MKLATYRDGSRDGKLVLVTRNLALAAFVPDIAHTLQAALDRWTELEHTLRLRAEQLETGRVAGAFPFNADMCMAPLPRAYQWADGSAYLNHVELVRRARGEQMPPEFLHEPLMYQGGSDVLLGAHDDIVCGDAAWGIDFEAEAAVITGDVPAGATPAEAEAAVRLIVLVNDVSLRNLIPGELAKGFGFVQSKPASAFSPVAVTPDELGDAWRDGKVHLQLNVWRGDDQVGRLRMGDDMQFSFGQLIAHLARTRSLAAGSIIGAGTVSNRDEDAGYGCIAERRMKEIIEHGAARTPFLQHGERVRIEARNGAGDNVLGDIRQRVLVPVSTHMA